MEPLVQQVRQDKLDHRERLVQPERLVHRGQWDYPDRLVQLEHKALGYLARRALQAPQVFQVYRV